MVFLPSGLAPLLPLFSRSWLNRLETHALPELFWKIPSCDQTRLEWSSIRTAFLKQSLYSDLYITSPGKDVGTVIKSSLKRTGPMGLLTDLNAQFFNVREDPAPECRAWEESVGSNPGTREEDLARAREHGRRMGGIAVDAVPWNSLDVVISLDICVPGRIRRQHPRILWVYFPADPGTPTAKAARRRPPEGFDVSLSHSHRRFSVRPGLVQRTVEFPYSFQSSFSWDLIWPSDSRRTGVMVENQTYAAMEAGDRRKLEAFGPVRVPRGSVDEVAVALRSAKYYLRLQGGPLSGNGQIEAIMSGALALGDPETFVQRSLFTPATIAPTLKQAMEKISRWEGSPELYRKDREEQLAVAEFVCFRRPAFQLLSMNRKKRGQP